MDVHVHLTGVTSSEAMALAIKINPIILRYTPTKPRKIRYTWTESNHIEFDPMSGSLLTFGKPAFITVIGGNIELTRKARLSHHLEKVTGLETTVS